MSQNEVEQTCPFCNARWGQCAHFRILAEWEAAAEIVDKAEVRAAGGLRPGFGGQSERHSEPAGK